MGDTIPVQDFVSSVFTLTWDRTVSFAMVNDGASTLSPDSSITLAITLCGSPLLTEIHFPCAIFINSLYCSVTSFSAFLFLSFDNMVAADVVPLGRPSLRSTVFSIITGRGCFRSLILAYT